MKIVFTTKGEDWDSQMDARFGRAEKFIMLNEENNELTVIANSETDGMEHGAGLQTSQKVLDLNPDVIITGNGAGNKALAILQKSEVKMYTGAGDMTIQEAYEAYKNNTLQLQF